MKDYNWGTVSLYKWKTRNGFESEGILYKPEDFDSTKKYPMLVYFYETHSEGLYNYLAPQPSRSTINIPYFVSNGYLVFTPDIHYTIGHPGQSALDCIVPGVELLCKNSWVDKDNIGIQGQSWGGYQVAYMVTRPEVFKWKAAGAGAPVANMTSAYGGIRWGSGMVRQFQYEDTQSRIGKTLWEGLDLYLENSPLFHADKVQTPLLIMSNDKDDAVPWYQGIEYFTALKRLGKTAWLLQYNDEYHNLRERVSAKDLTIRLQQFFDHYLKGKPMPVWMKTGVPATMKGIDWGFDLTE
jgi:dipeptidyl aminopeptidase/acylaminoacyl peptidase